LIYPYLGLGLGDTVNRFGSTNSYAQVASLFWAVAGICFFVLENLLVSLLKKLVNLLPGGAVGAGCDIDVGSFLPDKHRGLLEGEKVKGACWASVTAVSTRSSAHYGSMAPHRNVVLHCSDHCDVQLPAVYEVVVWGNAR